YYDDDTERPESFSSAQHYHSPSPPHAKSHGQVRRLSGSLNVPTHVGLEQNKHHKRSLNGIGKLKSAGRVREEC
ncbi:hypothetical protein EJ02DRAFT_333165, partial [Clathrospora elynae]